MSNQRLEQHISSARGLKRLLLVAGLAAMFLVNVAITHSATIAVPGASFESPATFFATPIVDSWQLMPQPAWWNEAATGPWTNLVGVFKNDPPSSTEHIDNCQGNQAVWLFANPSAGFFQDYDSMDWNDSSPTHAFNAAFEVGKSYRLTVGVIGGGYNMLPGTPLEASLYYRDAVSNKVTVASTTIIYSATYFSNRTHFVDFIVTSPTVRAGDAWAGKNIGIKFLSTVSSELEGGYWDLDNVRLTSILAPILLNPVRTNGQFQFTLQSEPGLAFQILASTNLTLPSTNWTSLGFVTNITGTIPFVDTPANFPQRFYQARQLP